MKMSLRESRENFGEEEVAPEEEAEEEEDDDDIEPKLTYDRIGNDVAALLKIDTASCLTLYERVCLHFLFSFRV